MKRYKLLRAYIRLKPKIKKEIKRKKVIKEENPKFITKGKTELATH